MPEKLTRFQHAISAIDQKNSDDPNMVTWEGKSFPKELLYSMRMSDCLDEFAPDASEALQLAVRAHHICRWKIERSEFPQGRSGYLKWRNKLKVMHADLTSTILSEVGYEKEFISNVSDLILKKGLKKNAQAQMLEDVICLVFLEYYLEDFTRKTPREKVTEILRKTWRKMSLDARERALKIAYIDEIKNLVNTAIENK